MEVRVLSSALSTVGRQSGPWPSGKAPPLHGGDRRFESDRVHLAIIVQRKLVRLIAFCGRSSVVERLLAKEKVVSSNLIARSFLKVTRKPCGFFCFGIFLSIWAAIA